MKQRAVLTSIAAVAVLFSLAPVAVLDVALERTGRRLWRVPVAASARVDLHYVNSIFNAPTTERFVAQGRMLRLVEINSTREAVLEYLALEPPFERRGDRLAVRKNGPLFDELVIRIGLTGQQWLALDGLKIPLYRTGVGEAVRVRLSRVPRLVARLSRSQAHF